MRSESEVNYAVDTYADLVRRICFCHLKNDTDTEDIFQNVFLKYMLYNGTFESAEHEKAWFIRVSINACNDFFKNMFRRNTVPLDEVIKLAAEDTNEQSAVLQAVLSLPEKYRDVIYLHYYESYSAAEIADILKSREGTVYSLLSRGRSMLKKLLGGEFDG
ncbi:MAG: sigma-70 family RNA polymerase sigma factor [Acutalibacteraceae bacterium]|nr:sigma-70 family RNA polymerase sigma factor [Acutalibacteraceae bacterium]